MADSFTPLLNLRLQQTGGNTNTWGDLNNSDVITPLENAIAGRSSYTTTGGTLDLSASPVVAQQVVILGVLVSDVTVIFPDLTKRMLLINGTSGGFQVLAKSGAAGATTNIPQGTAKDVRCTGSATIMRTDANEVGEIKYFGNATVPAGYHECDGTALSRTLFPDLFAAIGTTWGAGNGATTFNLPDFYTAGRFLRSRSPSVGIGTLQAADIAAHNHTASATTSVSLSIAADGAFTPTISISDPGHTHTPNQGNPGAQFSVFVGSGGGVGAPGGTNYSTTGVTASSTTGITASSTGIGNHSHGGSSASASTSVTVNNSTGVETRPVNASALCCIRL